MISGAPFAGEAKHKFRFYHADTAKGLEIPFVMWLDERMRVVSLQVDPERTVNALPGVQGIPKPGTIKVIRSTSTGQQHIVALPEASVEATRLLDSQVPLQNPRQERIRLRMLQEISETIEDPNCPSQACTAGAIRRKYRQQMESTFGASD